MAIGWLTGVYSGMQIIFTPILGKLSDRFGRRPVLLVSIAGTAVGFALMGMAQSLTLLFVARILAGIPAPVRLSAYGREHGRGRYERDPAHGDRNSRARFASGVGVAT